MSDAGESDDTIVVPRVDDDRTVVVPRPGRRRAEPEPAFFLPPVGGSTDDDATDDKTIVRPRAARDAVAADAADDKTIARPRTGQTAANDAADDKTIARPRAVRDAAVSDVIDETVVSTAADDETIVRPGRARRRAATAPALAPVARSQKAPSDQPVAVPSRFAPSSNAARGVGVDAVHAYRPRPIPPAPAASTVSTEGETATRLDAPHMPSVHRASRRSGIAALAWLVGACIVSVAGLVALYGVVFG